tara:strand:- start:6067 stop:6234 length:168 start_codon:yes stop_codon:yes gene_type:complete
MILAKKKKYTPRKDEDWDTEEAKEHRIIITEKEKAIGQKYRKFWDMKKGCWKKDG